MPDERQDPLLLAITGPTASGKTALSLAVAKALDGEIVSCDSVAVYREFEIGTAKPSAAERRLVAHHLIDVADPATASFTAGEYARLGRAAIQEIKQRGKLPVVVGGTGLYLRALLEGLFSGPQRSEQLRERLREKASKRGAQHLYRILQRLDAASARGIHPNDTPKVIRGIEICLTAGEKMSQLWEQGREPLRGFRIVYVGLNPPREQLYERINQRCHAMFDSGLVEETRQLAERYPHIAQIPNSPLNSPGYKQAMALLKGEITREEAVRATQQAHRNYAKRQLTWFRGIAGMNWVESFGDEPVTHWRTIEWARDPQRTSAKFH